MNKTLKVAAGAAVLASTLLLTGCGAPEAGYITDKDWSEEYESFYMQCYSYDSKGFCTVNMPVYYTEPAHFNFLLRDGEDEGWVRVSESVYNSYGTGDFYDTNG